MKNKTLLIVITSLAWLQSCYLMQMPNADLQEKSNEHHYDLPPQSEPGKCYAKCLVADKLETEMLELPLFIGDNDLAINNPNIESREIVISKKSQQKEISTKYVLIVKDTAIIRDFEIVKFEITKVIQKGGHTEWTEVV